MTLDTLRYALRRGVIALPEGLDDPIDIEHGTVEHYGQRIADSLARSYRERRRAGLHRPYGRKLAPEFFGTLKPPSLIAFELEQDGPEDVEKPAEESALPLDEAA